MLYAPRGVGKTSWLFRSGLAVASGSPFLRWHAPRQRRVLYVDGEMPLVSLQERLRAISTGLGAVIPNDGFRKDSRRASEVFDSILALFRRDDQERRAINVNAIALEVLRSSRGELAEHRVTTRTELASKLPLIPGHKGQLQQVISNLVQNAIEAMDNTADRDRVLQVRTGLQNNDAILVGVEDFGSGFDPKRLGSLFDAFFTTKSHGIGLGLAICRMIVERHGGQLTAASDGTLERGSKTRLANLNIRPASTCRGACFVFRASNARSTSIFEKR